MKFKGGEIWIINPYGTLPSESWREYRSSLVSNALATRGHSVKWWMSNFEHRSKKFREIEFIDREGLHSNVEMRFIKSSSYKYHVSLERILYERRFGINALTSMRKHKPPDLIVMVDPSLFFGNYILKYCKENKVKLIVDIQDLWPEQFELAVPKRFRFLSKLLFFSLYIRRNRIIEYSTGVIGITKDYIDEVLRKASIINKPSIVSYLGVNLKDFQINKNRNEGASLDVINQFVMDACITCVYAGTLGEAYALDTLAQGIEKSILRNRNIKFIIAGSGSQEDLVSSLASKYPTNILFLGSVDPKLLPYIYSKCDIGICSYSRGSVVSMPCKFYDYLAGGLAVLNSLGREIESFINEKSIGINFKPEDVNSFSDSLNLYSSNKQILALHKSNASRLALNFDSPIIYNNLSEFVESFI
jgi:glycosyltransferase involved in cell wall biosynthesis